MTFSKHRRALSRLLIVGSVAASSLIGLPALAAGTNPKAMTWGSRYLKTSIPNLPNKVVYVGCHAAPAPDCNPYTGDTLDTEKHRILCFVPGAIAMPPDYGNYFQSNFNGAGLAVNDWHFYYNWSGGQIGLSKLVKGTDLTQKSDGDTICKGTDGLNDSAARMMEFHDNGVGGWSAGGMLHPNSKAKLLLEASQSGTERFWVAINDQSSNPWD